MTSAAILGLTREWIETLAVAIGAVVAAASAAVAAYEYRLKARAERAESDTKLARLFADLVPIADGYTQAYLPDGLAPALIEAGVLTADDFSGGDKDGPNNASVRLAKSMVNAPVGAVTMAATLRAIAELGRRHEVLRGPAREAVDGLVHHRDHEVTKYAWERASALIPTRDAARRSCRRR